MVLGGRARHPSSHLTFVHSFEVEWLTLDLSEDDCSEEPEVAVDQLHPVTGAGGDGIRDPESGGQQVLEQTDFIRQLGRISLGQPVEAEEVTGVALSQENETKLVLARTNLAARGGKPHRLAILSARGDSH